MPPKWSNETEQLRVLESRRVYLESLVEKFGDPGGHKSREAHALAWVLDGLSETNDLADAVAEAVALVAALPPRVGR
jgi:hypothetical protein